MANPRTLLSIAQHIHTETGNERDAWFLSIQLVWTVAHDVHELLFSNIKRNQSTINEQKERAYVLLSHASRCHSIFLSGKRVTSTIAEGKTMFIRFAYRIGWPDVSEIIYGSPFLLTIHSFAAKATNEWHRIIVSLRYGIASSSSMSINFRCVLYICVLRMKHNNNSKKNEWLWPIRYLPFIQLTERRHVSHTLEITTNEI